MPICVADVESDDVRWIWDRRIPSGALTILQGHPNTGKSLLSIDLAARISRGKAMPEDSHPGLGKSRPVLFIAPEDDAKSVLCPRLERAGADLRQILFLSHDEIDDLRHDPLLLVTHLESLEPALVVADPITALIGTSSEKQIRRSLEQWKEAAGQSESGILLIRHFQKVVRGNVNAYGLGSIALSAIARSTLSMETVCEKKREAILSVTKFNYAFPPAHLRLRVGATVEWQGVSARGVTDLLGDLSRPLREEAKEALILLLAEGPVKVQKLKKASKQHGVSWGTLIRAKQELGIVSKRHGFGMGSHGTWELPDDPEIQARKAELKKQQIDQLVDDLQLPPAAPGQRRPVRRRYSGLGVRRP